MPLTPDHLMHTGILSPVALVPSLLEARYPAHHFRKLDHERLGIHQDICPVVKGSLIDCLSTSHRGWPAILRSDEPSLPNMPASKQQVQ